LNDTCSCHGFNLSPVTGIVNFSPALQEISVMAIQVDEYRADTNGAYEKIGSIRRDIEMYVRNCQTNRPPLIPGINGGNNFSEKICSGQQTCFKVLAFDLDQPDSAKISWNGPGDMKGATFTVLKDGKKWPTAVFCWYAVDSDARILPYTFKATAKDNGRPVDSSSKTFSVYVIANPRAIYSATIAKGGCGLVTFNAKQDPGSFTSITKYLWVGDRAPGQSPLNILGQTCSYQYTRGGLYHYTLIISGPNGCTTSYSDSIYVPPSLKVDRPKDTIVCAKSPFINLWANVSIGTPPYSYSWNTGETSQTKSALISSDTFFKVTVTDAAGCTDFDSAFIHFQVPPAPKSPTVINKCPSTSLQLTAWDIGPQVVWTAIIKGKTIPFYSDTNPLTVVDSGIYIATTKNSIICPGEDSFIVRLVKDTVRSYSYNLCSPNGSIFTTGSNVAWIDSGVGWSIDSIQNNYVKVPSAKPKYKIKY